MPLQLSHQKFILVCVISVLFSPKTLTYAAKCHPCISDLRLYFSFFFSANIYDMKKVKIATPTLEEWSVEAEADAWFICSCIIWFLSTPANDVVIIFYCYLCPFANFRLNGFVVWWVWWFQDPKPLKIHQVVSFYTTMSRAAHWNTALFSVSSLKVWNWPVWKEFKEVHKHDWHQWNYVSQTRPYVIRNA